MARIDTTNGFITSNLGCYSVFTADGALQVRTNDWDRAEDADEVGTYEGAIRRALIREFALETPMEVAKVNEMGAIELEDWAELLAPLA